MTDALRKACPDCVMGFLPGTEDEHGRELPAHRCPTCEGSGMVRDATLKKCPACNGRGSLRASDFFKGEGLVFVQDDMGECPACNGTGVIKP